MKGITLAAPDILDILEWSGAVKETDIATRLGHARAAVHRVCLDLERRQLISRDTQRPIRWHLTIYGLDMAKGRVIGADLA